VQIGLGLPLVLRSVCSLVYKHGEDGNNMK
jgi:hypothetical protein